MNDLMKNQNGEETNVLAPKEEMPFVDPGNFPDLESAEEGFSIKAESFEFTNIGESLRCVFLGFTFWTVKDQANVGQYIQRETALFQTKTGIKGNMGASMVKSLKNVPPGTALQITYKGEEKTNNNRNVKVYDIITLRVPRVDVIAPAKKTTPSLPKSVAEENVNQETGYEEAVKMLVNPMDYEMVNLAAKEWGIEASSAAKEIARMKLGNRIERDEFIQIVREGKTANLR